MLSQGSDSHKVKITACTRGQQAASARHCLTHHLARELWCFSTVCLCRGKAVAIQIARALAYLHSRERKVIHQGMSLHSKLTAIITVYGPKI